MYCSESSKTDSDLKSILKAYCDRFLSPNARSLDISDLSAEDEEDGSTTPISVSRYDIIASANEDFACLESIDPRIPLKVTFHVESE